MAKTRSKSGRNGLKNNIVDNHARTCSIGCPTEGHSTRIEHRKLVTGTVGLGRRTRSRGHITRGATKKYLGFSYKA